MNPIFQTRPHTLNVEHLLQLYDPGELAILCDWLEIPRPEQIRGLEHEWLPYASNGEGSPGPIRLMCNADGGEDRAVALSNAVARLALSSIQGRLPQWAAVYESGRVDLGRKYSPRRSAGVEPMPRFLFGINWADSGPGFSWPEDYYATWLPGFDCFVVTAYR